MNRKSVSLYVLLSLLVPMVAFAGSVETPEMDIGKGDTGIVTADHEGDTVYVWNPTPIGNRDQVLKYGDSCVIKERDFVSVIGLDGDWVLVRYSVTSTQMNYPCPSGTIFYIAREVFLGMKSAQEEKNRIRQLLKEEKE